MHVPDAHEHVFAFFRTIRTAQGRRLVENLPADGSAEDFVDQLEVEKRYVLDADAHGLLEELKERKLRPLLGDHVYDYDATWTGSGITTDHIGSLPETLDECLELLDDEEPDRTLCVDVWRSLAGIIRRQIGDLESRLVVEDEIEPDLEREIASHVAYGRERIERQERYELFMGGPLGPRDVLRTIRDYIGASEPCVLGIVGEPGSGSPALMAEAAKEAKEEHPAAAIVVRFIGATPDSSDVQTLLDTLCREIAHAFGAKDAVPTDYQDLVREFPKRLALASAGRPLVLFLDGLHQLSDADQAHDLVWLPASLPEHVRVVVSTYPQLLETLEAKRPAPRILRSSGFGAGGLDSLSRDDLGELFDRRLEDAYRTLDEQQHGHVLDFLGHTYETPLFLGLAFQLAFEEARTWRSYTEPRPFGQDVRGVIRDLFARLARPEHHGRLMVERTLGYLAASRDGLAEDELLDVLSADDELYAYVAKHAHHALPATNGNRQLPVVLWSRLFLDLKPYLTERRVEDATLLSFFHREVTNVASEMYLAGESGKARHAALAAYFRRRADQQQDGSSTGHTRALNELPYHLANAER
jgi:hypothetical protein